MPIDVIDQAKKFHLKWPKSR